jgi:hypothetical protein
MTTNPTIVPPRRGWRLLHWFFIALAAMVVVVAAEVGSIFLLSAEASDLRRGFADSTDLAMETKVQLSIGPGLLGLGRLVTSFIDEVPPEAREAMKAVRRTSVGVYELDRLPSETERINFWRLATEKLTQSGWRQVVSVQEGAQSVMVFMPATESSGDEIEICLAVCEGRNLVIVSAMTATEPLLKLARHQSKGWADIWDKS